MESYMQFAPQEREGKNQLIIHKKCGLPVELCECPDAPVVYDWETDAFNEQDNEE